MWIFYTGALCVVDQFEFWGHHHHRENTAFLEPDIFFAWISWSLFAMINSSSCILKAYYRNYNVRLFWSKFTKYILLFSKKIQSCLKCTFLAQINPLWWIYFTCIQQINCWTIYLVDRLATIVPEFLKSCINAPVDIFTCQTMKRSFVWIYLLNSYTEGPFFDGWWKISD